MKYENDTQYALKADPNKELREKQAEIDRLQRQINSMRTDYYTQMEKVIAERDVYRSLVLKVMNLKD